MRGGKEQRSSPPPPIRAVAITECEPCGILCARASHTRRPTPPSQWSRAAGLTVLALQMDNGDPEKLSDVPGFLQILGGGSWVGV